MKNKGDELGMDKNIETYNCKPHDKIAYHKILRNWIHQGITYMDTGELSIRLLIELLQFLVILYFFYLFLNTYFFIGTLVIFGLVFVHTFNWIFNMNFYALMMFSIPSLKNRGESITIDYLNSMADRLKHSKNISGLAIFGSISRNQWHEKSDIDARILRKPGLKNLLGAAIITMKERFLALILRQPLDIYLADNIDFLKKMRKDEAPIFLIKRDQRLEENYPNNPETKLTQLKIKY
jgi:predicted nucleotidyltransferase